MNRRIIKKILPKRFIELTVRIVAKSLAPYYQRKYGFAIRKGTTDFEVYTDIFVLKHYDLPYKAAPNLIVDCGAYVGYSAIYFAAKFPRAKIIALEPSSSNFRSLQNNTLKYPTISCIQKAVWHKCANLKIVNSHSAHSFSVMESETSDFDVSSVTISEIIQLSGFEKIDILKMDIEGAEVDIFSKTDIPWLNKVDTYIFEFHDRLKPGCSKAVFDKLSASQYNILSKGEYTIFQRKNA